MPTEPPASRLAFVMNRLTRYEVQRVLRALGALNLRRENGVFVHYFGEYPILQDDTLPPGRIITRQRGG